MRRRRKWTTRTRSEEAVRACLPRDQELVLGLRVSKEEGIELGPDDILEEGEGNDA